MKLTKKSIIGFNDGFLDAAPLDDCADERQIVVDDHALQSVVISMLTVISYNTYLSLLLEQFSVESKIPDPT